jgi:hypothetical protein
MKYKYRLIVDAGEYEANSLIGLLTAVLSHRFTHFVNGDGWVD